MNKVENVHSQSFLEGIVKGIATTLGLDDDKKFGKQKFYEMITCYFLWKVQTDQTIKTPADMDSRGFRRETIQFACMPFDDVCGYFDDSKECWERMLGLIGKYTDEELAECLIYVDYYDDDFFENTPNSITRLVDKFLQIQKNDLVLEINAETCDYTIESQKSNEGASYTALSDEYVGMIKASIISDVLGFTDMLLTCEPDEEIKYSKVFANNIIDPAKPRRCSVINWYVEEHWPEFPIEISNVWNASAWALLSVAEEGKAVALMNAGQLTVKQFEEVRKFMCHGGYIEGVIMLPDKMYEDTWINPYLVVLGRGKNKVKFYDASSESEKYRIKGKRINVFNDKNINKIYEEYTIGENIVEVSIDELELNDYNLNPLRYLTKNDETTKTIKLGDALREVKRGMTLSASDMDVLISEEPSDKKCIVPASISGGMISSRLFYQGDLKKPGKNEVHYGQILVSKTGNPFRAALANENFLVAGNLYILDINSSILNPSYLRCFLNSELGQKELKKYATVSTTPVISIANLQKIEVPIFEEKRQIEINRRCEEIVADLDKCYKQIADNEEEIDSIFE